MIVRRDMQGPAERQAAQSATTHVEDLVIGEATVSSYARSLQRCCSRCGLRDHNFIAICHAFYNASLAALLLALVERTASKTAKIVLV